MAIVPLPAGRRRIFSGEGHLTFPERVLHIGKEAQRLISLILPVLLGEIDLLERCQPRCQTPIRSLDDHLLNWWGFQDLTMMPIGKVTDTARAIGPSKTMNRSSVGCARF